MKFNGALKLILSLLILTQLTCSQTPYKTDVDKCLHDANMRECFSSISKENITYFDLSGHENLRITNSSDYSLFCDHLETLHGDDDYEMFILNIGALNELPCTCEYINKENHDKISPIDGREIEWLFCPDMKHVVDYLQLQAE